MKLSAPFIFFKLLIALIFLLFILPTNSFAAIFYDTQPPSGANYTIVSAEFCGVAAQCANTYTTSTRNSACGLNGCGGGLNWTKYELTCIYDVVGFRYDGYYQQLGERVYSIGDKCISGETGLRPGFCNGNYGDIYKRCCSNYTPVACIPASSTLQDGIYPDEGGCPAGSTETAPGVTSCPTPPPPSRCPAGVEAGQACSTCTTQTCSNGTACGTGHEYCIYDPTNGNYCSSCITENNTCSSSCISVSCSVAWNISPTNPLTNSTVNVSVTGTATPNWNGASYSLDGSPSWISAGSGPPFNFSVSSGSAGIHNLRFSINNGSTVCSDQNSQTFITQAPIDASTCTAISISGNPVYAGRTYPATVSLRNDGTSTWTSSDLYKLGSQDPQDNTVWGTNRVNLPVSSVSPGNSTTFNFNVTAPQTTGQQSFNWQMVHEGITWFGSKCVYNVPVSSPPPLLPPPPTVSCSVSPTTASTNQNVTWTANAKDGTSPYTYSWSGTDSLSGTSSSVTKSYSTQGTKTGSVSVTDSAGQASPFTNCPNVTITSLPDLTVDPIIITPTPPATGNTVTFSTIVRNLGGTAAAQSTTRLSYKQRSETTWTDSDRTTGILAVNGNKTETWSKEWTVPSVTVNTTYNFRVCADALSVVSESNETNNCTSRDIIVTPSGSTIPPTPGAFSQTASSPTAGCSGTSPYVDLSWTSSANAQTYSVFRNSSPIITDLLSSTQFFRDLNVGATTTYNYLIRAVNTAGSTDSDTKSVTTLNCSSQTSPGGCAWIQTTGGDVHSNTGINTPCGP